MAHAGPKEVKKPPRTAEQSTRFGKAKKRLPPKGQLALDDEVKNILANPLIGEMKTGALKGVRVHKFKLGPAQFLLAYEFNERRNLIELPDLGPHENFYRNLQNYLEDRP
jgi:mRNA-degrading endonuclease RelE of RelBE toxin-antitoxin system